MIIEIADRSQVSQARRAAERVAQAAGFDEGRTGRVALIATELGTNLVKHVQHGRIAISTYNDVTGSGIELLAFDNGGGITNIGHALLDGTSTAGSMGSGLGAIQRQSDGFDIFSLPDNGTVVVARVSGASATTTQPRTGAIVGSLAAPLAGESVSGDGWAYGETRAGPTVLLVDGSGHGPHAAAAASAAKTAFFENIELSCTELAEALHRALSPTRGGAVGLARVALSEQLIRYVGIGNIAGTLLSNGTVKKMVSNNGIAGHVVSRIHEFTYPYAAPATVILHSDGLTGRWDLNDYPGLAYRHPSIIAAALYRDFLRGRDDAAVVVLRV